MDRPTTGLVNVTGGELAEVVTAVEGVLATPEALARLSTGGAAALPAGLEAWATELETRSAALPELEAHLKDVRQQMLDVVVPSTIVYLTIGVSVALSVLAFSFVFPDLRGIFFPASGGVLASLVLYAVFKSWRSAQDQRRLQTAVYDAVDAVEAVKAESKRLPALLSALGLPASPEGREAARGAAAGAGWSEPVGDPELPLVVEAREATAHLELLKKLSRARLVIVLGDTGAEVDWDQVLDWALVSGGASVPTRD